MRFLRDHCDDPESDARFERLEKQLGKGWDEKYGFVFDGDVELPDAISKAIIDGDTAKVMRWIGPFPVPKKRINATDSAMMRMSILTQATMHGRLELATMALQYGADVNQLDAYGGCALEEKCMLPNADRDIQSIKLLKEWGGEIIGNSKKQRREISLLDEENRDAVKEFLPKMMEGTTRIILETRGFAKCKALFDDPLVGRRCEIVNLSGNNSHLNGRVGVVVKYLEDYGDIAKPAMGSDRFKFVFENSKEACVARRENLKRRDRTPLDCGYWLTYKKGRFERKTFKTPEECRAHVTSLAKGKSVDEVTTEIDPEAEIKANEAAAELLAELGLDDSAADSHEVNRKPKKRGKRKKGKKK